MYQWTVFLHVFFAFTFMLAHGVQAAAMLRFRQEPDPQRSLTIMYKYGPGYYGLIERAATRLIEARKTNTNLADALKEFDEARNTWYSMVVSIVGIAGLASILWLMQFKPF